MMQHICGLRVLALFWAVGLVEVRAEKAPLTVELDNTMFLIWDENKLNWTEALEFCEKQGMKLLSLETEEKQSKLNDFMKAMGLVDGPDTGTNYMYWTSGNDRKKQNAFVWETTGHQFNYTNWLPGNPDNWRDDENCVEMGYRELGKWNDQRCWYHRHFICERDVGADTIKGTT